MKNRKAARQIVTWRPETRSYRPYDLRQFWQYIEMFLTVSGDRNSDRSIKLRPRDPVTDVWSWSAQDVQPQTEYTQHAQVCGELLVVIALWLQLERAPPEVPYAFLVDEELVIDIIDVSNDAVVYRMTSGFDIELFNQSRDRLRRPSIWDQARNRRLMRVDDSGGRYVLEPGVNFFVEWLEAHGGTTFYSCEGHPGGFYLVFAANPQFARRLALPGVLDVQPIQSRVIDLPTGKMTQPNEIGVWTGYIARGITDYDDLDATLCALAVHWKQIGSSHELSIGEGNSDC